MRITEQQIECLDTLIVERLCSHKVDNLALVERFSNPRNNVLVSIIKSQKAINRDEANTIKFVMLQDSDLVDEVIELDKKSRELTVKGDEDLMVVTDKGMIIRTPLKDISSIGRDTKGVRIISLNEEHKVSAIVVVDSSANE